MSIFGLITDWFRNRVTIPRERYFPEKPAPRPSPEAINSGMPAGSSIRVYPGPDDQHDSIIRKYSGKYGIPWQLVKAVIWQESRFKPDASSWCGAKGLMQLMPAVYGPAGIDPYDPENNIRVGCSHLKEMWNIFKKESGLERWKFALGAYNAGPGYVISAQNLAKKKSARTDKWYHISVLIDSAEVNRKRCDWKQVTEYVDIVINRMFDYILLENLGKEVKDLCQW